MGPGCKGRKKSGPFPNFTLHFEVQKEGGEGGDGKNQGKKKNLGGKVKKGVRRGGRA